jgi:hypothetical protein
MLCHKINFNLKFKMQFDVKMVLNKKMSFIQSIYILNMTIRYKYIHGNKSDTGLKLLVMFSALNLIQLTNTKTTHTKNH